VLPADERADPADGGLADPKTARVALAPDHPFRICRHQLPVPVEQCTVGSDQDDRVVERGATEFAVTLVNSAHDYDVAPGRCLTKRSQFVGLQVDAVGE